MTEKEVIFLFGITIFTSLTLFPTLTTANASKEPWSNELLEIKMMIVDLNGKLSSLGDVTSNLKILDYAFKVNKFDQKFQDIDSRLSHMSTQMEFMKDSLKDLQQNCGQQYSVPETTPIMTKAQRLPMTDYNSRKIEELSKKIEDYTTQITNSHQQLIASEEQQQNATEMLLVTVQNGFAKSLRKLDTALSIVEQTPVGNTTIMDTVIEAPCPTDIISCKQIDDCTNKVEDYGKKIIRNHQELVSSGQRQQNLTQRLLETVRTGFTKTLQKLDMTLTMEGKMSVITNTITAITPRISQISQTLLDLSEDVKKIKNGHDQQKSLTILEIANDLSHNSRDLRSVKTTLNQLSINSAMEFSKSTRENVLHFNKILEMEPRITNRLLGVSRDITMIKNQTTLREDGKISEIVNSISAMGRTIGVIREMLERFSTRLPTNNERAKADRMSTLISKMYKDMKVVLSKLEETTIKVGEIGKIAEDLRGRTRAPSHAVTTKLVVLVNEANDFLLFLMPAVASSLVEMDNVMKA